MTISHLVQNVEPKAPSPSQQPAGILDCVTLPAVGAGKHRLALRVDPLVLLLHGSGHRILASRSMGVSSKTGW